MEGVASVDVVSGAERDRTADPLLANLLPTGHSNGTIGQPVGLSGTPDPLPAGQKRHERGTKGQKVVPVVEVGTFRVLFPSSVSRLPDRHVVYALSTGSTPKITSVFRLFLYQTGRGSA